MKSRKLLSIPALMVYLLLALVLIPGTGIATDVYKWTDENGVLHFGDRPPQNLESSEIELEERHRPDAVINKPPLAENEASGQIMPAEDVEEEKSVAQKRREQIAKASKERREEQAELNRRCSLHKDRLARMEPARRVFYTNEQGESVRMDDDRRISLVEESKDFIANNCD